MTPPIKPLPPPRAEAQTPASPLGALLVHIAQARAEAGVPAVQDTLAHFRQLWGRLSTEQQLRQSVASVPEGAGPLNSQRLVLRALQAMQALSPGCLNRYMAYVDTLLWLDQAGAEAVATPAAATPARKPARSRRKSPTAS